MAQTLPAKTIQTRNYNVFDKRGKFLFSIPVGKTLLLPPAPGKISLEGQKGTIIYIFFFLKKLKYILTISFFPFPDFNYIIKLTFIQRRPKHYLLNIISKLFNRFNTNSIKTPSAFLKKLTLIILYSNAKVLG